MKRCPLFSDFPVNYYTFITPTDLPHKYNVPALFLSDKTSPYTTGNIQFPLFAQHSLCKIQFFFQTSSFLLQILYSKQNAFDNHFLTLSQEGRFSIHSVLQNPVLRTFSTQNNSMKIHRFLLTGQIHFPICLAPIMQSAFLFF